MVVKGIGHMKHKTLVIVDGAIPPLPIACEVLITLLAEKAQNYAETQNVTRVLDRMRKSGLSATADCHRALVLALARCRCFKRLKKRVAMLLIAARRVTVVHVKENALRDRKVRRDIHIEMHIEEHTCVGMFSACCIL